MDFMYIIFVCMFLFSVLVFSIETFLPNGLDLNGSRKQSRKTECSVFVAALALTLFVLLRMYFQASSADVTQTPTQCSAQVSTPTYYVLSLDRDIVGVLYSSTTITM